MSNSYEGKLALLSITAFVAVATFLHLIASNYYCTVGFAPPDLRRPSSDGCDYSRGKWVFDDVSRPLYREEECGFLTAQVTCCKNGRKDSLYQKWRWQPTNCSLPKFDARILLEKLKGKRVLFVGDSLMRNQWESMVCLLNSGASPVDRKMWKLGVPFSIFSIQEYNVSVEFYWAPFLVDSNSDDPRNHTISERIIKPDSISGRAELWIPADVLVFNTYIWWMNHPTIKVVSSDGGWNSTEEVDRTVAFEKVITTWADWMRRNVDRAATSSFFVGLSPIHHKGAYWNKTGGGGGCGGETLPIAADSDGAVEMGTDRGLLEIVKKVIKGSGIQVTVVDITAMSEHRKDGHTSVYTVRQGKLLTPEQQADTASFADCLHWCLPGVPDVWNEILYSYIVKP
ncbi:hypothetical protein M569_04078 [Genlisea aurea]|uniref:Uncharacterized protein n=1 Tax=Genlisea aurea TaxID=192259 RepID=S8EDP3_9LAMI|nr:hypothetical protein M569_04078 [Genlisea aurea]